MMIRYHPRPFLAGRTIHAPGYYTWEPGRFAVTVRPCQPPHPPGATVLPPLPETPPDPTAKYRSLFDTR